MGESVACSGNLGAPPPPAAPAADKWGRWNHLLEDANDRPSERTALRRITVPVVAAVATVMILVVLSPPFVCDGKKGTISVFRLLVWGVIAGGVTALLTAQGVFARFAKTS